MSVAGWGGAGGPPRRRAGTENVPAIVGLARALEIVAAERAREAPRLAALRAFFVRELERLGGFVLGAEGESQLPHITNVLLLTLAGEQMVLELDGRGIACATGSACSSGDGAPSRVIMALGQSAEAAGRAVRFSFGRETTRRELAFVLKSIREIIKKYQNL